MDAWGREISFGLQLNFNHSLAGAKFRCKAKPKLAITANIS